MISFGLSGYEIWIVLAVACLLFGHRIPKMARAAGSSIIEFKRGLKFGSDDPPEDPPKKIEVEDVE